MATKPNPPVRSIRPAAPLLTRTVAFLVVFVILSGTIGPHIISNGIVDKYGFQIYGGAGKAMLFGVLALSLLVWRKGAAITLQPWKPANIIWLILSMLAIACAWIGVDKLIAGNSEIAWVMLAHMGILASVVLAAGGIFGSANLRLIATTYKNELLIALGLAVGFFIFLYIVYGLWTILANIVLHSVSGLLSLSGLDVEVLRPRTLLLDKFGVQVAQFCSGIESIALFTALYGLIGVLDWQRFNHRRYLLICPVALIVLFGLNILRVYTLIMAGYYFNPQIAFSLFHSYAGMIFFILYSILFWALSYKWMLHKNEKNIK